MLFFSSLSQHVTKIFGPDFLVPCVSLCLRLNSFFPSYNDVNELPVLYESDNAINWNKFILTSNDIPGYSLLSINQFFLLLVHSDLFQDRCKYLLSWYLHLFLFSVLSLVFQQNFLVPYHLTFSRCIPLKTILALIFYGLPCMIMNFILIIFQSNKPHF